MHEKLLLLQEEHQRVAGYIEQNHGVLMYELNRRRRDKLPRGVFVVDNEVLSISQGGKGRGRYRDVLRCSDRHAFMLGLRGIQFPNPQSKNGQEPSMDRVVARPK